MMSRRGSPLNYHPPSNFLSQRPSRQGQDNFDTQRSLHEASAALETAFDRIRQVRRSLLSFSGTLPVDSPTTAPTNRDEISPGHEALLLSGGLAEDERGEPFNLSPIAPSQPGSATENRENVRPPNISSPISPSIQPVSPLSTNHNYLYTPELPSLLQVPPVPSVVPPRFSRQTSFNTHQAGTDTAATTHGLRVAAREATSNAQEMYRDRAMDFTSLATDYDRRYAQYRAAVAPNSLAITSLDEFAPVSTGIRRDGRRYRSNLPSPPLPFSASTAPMRNGDLSRSHWQWDRYPGMPDSLSNSPLSDRSGRQNYLPRPPLLQRELPMTLSVSSNAPVIPMGPSPFPSFPRTRPLTESPHAVMPGPESGFSNASTIEHPDWASDQFISWLLPQEYTPSLVPRRDPQNPDTIRITRTTETGSPPIPVGPRRRGWARLDPDGNEIPWDEEEALERSRTEYRLRVLHQPQDTPDMHRGVYDGQVFHGSVLDSMLSIPSVMPGSRSRESRQQQQQQRRRRGRRLSSSSSSSSSSADLRPFYIDPLPIPLSTMRAKVERVNTEEFYPDVVVPRYAFLAGR